MNFKCIIYKYNVLHIYLVMKFIVLYYIPLQIQN